MLDTISCAIASDKQLLDIVFVMEMFKQSKHSSKPQCNRF